MIDVKSLCDQHSSHGIDDFTKSIPSYEYQSWQIASANGEKLLHAIHDDQQQLFQYAMISRKLGTEYQSCTSWCKKQLTEIGIVFAEHWYQSFVVLPVDLLANPVAAKVAA